MSPLRYDCWYRSDIEALPPGARVHWCSVPRRTGDTPREDGTRRTAVARQPRDDLWGLRGPRRRRGSRALRRLRRHRPCLLRPPALALHRLLRGLQRRFLGATRWSSTCTSGSQSQSLSSKVPDTRPPTGSRHVSPGSRRSRLRQSHLTLKLPSSIRSIRPGVTLDRKNTTIKERENLPPHHHLSGRLKLIYYYYIRLLLLICKVQMN